MTTIPTYIDPSWHQFFESQYRKPYMTELFSFLEQQASEGVDIFPPQSLWFKAFELPVPEIKVIIIGQDPYMHQRQAMGLSFSVAKGEKIPPSLRNIYKELQSDVNLEPPAHGDLSRWSAQESIFLLNASLTVESAKAGSHLKMGWHQFTLAAIDYINNHTQHCVFLAWGAFAHKCCAKVDTTRHQLIKTSHPSPLGAYKQMKTAPAFLGSSCFSQVNDYLHIHQRGQVNWAID